MARPECKRVHWTTAACLGALGARGRGGRAALLAAGRCCGSQGSAAPPGRDRWLQRRLRRSTQGLKCYIHSGPKLAKQAFRSAIDVPLLARNPRAMSAAPGHGGGPGGSGHINVVSTFHNADPRTREKRLAAQSREKLENNLLKVRWSTRSRARELQLRQRGTLCDT